MRTPRISLENSVREDGTANRRWTAGIAVSIGARAAGDLARRELPLTRDAEAWLGVLTGAVPLVEVRGGELAALLGVAPLDARVVAGNRGSSDGFGWVPDHIGINVQALADTYGPPDREATDRAVRIVAHEYIHLLTYAFFPDHRERRRTPLDRALCTLFFEGLGDYVSVSRRWLPDAEGTASPAAADALRRLEPILVERLEQFVDADDEREKALRAGISMGRFDEKWGSLPVALWLHSEVKRCGEAATLRTILHLERDGVLLLAERHAAPALQPRIRALHDRIDRARTAAAPTATCLAHRRRP